MLRANDAPVQSFLDKAAIYYWLSIDAVEPVSRIDTVVRPFQTHTRTRSKCTQQVPRESCSL
ncbi:hypothetical protein MY10362_002606 [Beauveria mimosiformis]